MTKMLIFEDYCLPQWANTVMTNQNTNWSHNSFKASLILVINNHSVQNRLATLGIKAFFPQIDHSPPVVMPSTLTRATSG